MDKNLSALISAESKHWDISLGSNEVILTSKNYALNTGLKFVTSDCLQYITAIAFKDDSEISSSVFSANGEAIVEFCVKVLPKLGEALYTGTDTWINNFSSLVLNKMLSTKKTA